MKHEEYEKKFVLDMTSAFPETAGNVLADLQNLAKKITIFAMTDLLEGIKERHRYGSIKSIGVVYGYAKELGIKIGGEGKSFFYCGICKIKFSSDSRGCPQCGGFIDDINYKVGVATGDEVREVVLVREDCWECKHYDQNNQRCEGPTCGGWGMGHQGGPKCSKCICASCCNEKYMFKKDFRRYQELEQAGELEDRKMKEKRRA